LIRWRKIEQFFKHKLMRFLENRIGRPVMQPEEVDWNFMERILVIRPQDQMGDFLLSSPAIRALRNRFPESRIGIVVKDYFADTMTHSEFVDEILIFCRSGRDWTIKKFWMLWKQLYRKWDFAVVLSSESHSLTADVLALLSGAKVILGSERAIFGGCTRNFMYNLLAPDSPPGLHQSERNLDIVRYIKADTDDLSEIVHVAEEEKNALRDAYPDIYKVDSPVIGLHIGANKPENRWPVRNFVELAGRLKENGLEHLAIYWGPGENDLADAFFSQVGFEITRIPPSSLRNQIIHFSLCDVAVCNDTGVMHLCASVGTPLAAIFGPTDPRYWKPVGDRFTAIRSDDHRTKNVSIEEVFNTILKLLKEKSGPNNI
jgi:ADP-heptose:LPS heptosyltransferase